MGICHTCTRRKTRGAVKNLITGAVSTADDEDVQICVSVPVGDVELCALTKGVLMTITTNRQSHRDTSACSRRPVAGKTVRLTPEQAEAFGRELDAIKERVIADLGERDATYIRRMIKAQRGLEVGGRALLFGGIFPPFWLAGTAMLALSKIIDNMEIGHNVMHGQYDWMGDPAICTAARSNGTPPARPTSGGTRTTTCTTPTPTSWTWTATSATASCG